MLSKGPALVGYDQGKPYALQGFSGTLNAKERLTQIQQRHSCKISELGYLCLFLNLKFNLRFNSIFLDSQFRNYLMNIKSDQKYKIIRKYSSTIHLLERKAATPAEIA